MKIIRPYTTLLMLLVVATLCLLSSLFVPEGGMALGPFKLRFKTWNSLWATPEEQPKLNLEAYLNELDSLSFKGDSIAIDSLGYKQIIRTESANAIHFINDSYQRLWSFFDACESGEPTHIHVLHYGDSQIESDRMSGYLRQKLQERYGGGGPGLLSILPVANTSSVDLMQSTNWIRYSAYGYGEQHLQAKTFGPLCSFTRFSKPDKQTKLSTDTLMAWVEIRPSKIAAGKCKQYNTATFYLTNREAPCDLKVLANDSIISEVRLGMQDQMQKISCSFNSTPGVLRLEFKSISSPDVYAINLHNSSGVHLSNIPLRGNDGSVLKRMNKAEVQPVLQDLNAQLVILQFGGNAVPHLSGESGAKSLGVTFGTCIRHIQDMLPDAAILVIGPSDMSTSIDGAYQTWPYLEALNNGMKEAAEKNNCGFWDMYQVMGGKNSMIEWVQNDPPYAGPDYTHFTPLGARKMSEYLWKALEKEYELYKQAKADMTN